jgi:hypothetical protein
LGLSLGTTPEEPSVDSCQLQFTVTAKNNRS